MDIDRNGLRPIDELNQLSAGVESVQELAELKPIFSRVEEIAKQNAGATDIELAVKQVKMQLVNRGKKLKEAGALGTVSSPLPTGGHVPPSQMPAFPPPPPMSRHEMPTGPVIPVPSGENPARGSGQSPVMAPPPLPPPPQQRPTGVLNTPGPMPATGTGQRPTAGVFAVPQRPPAPPTPPSSGLNWKRAMAIGAGIGIIGAVGILVTIVNVARSRNKVPTPSATMAGINVTTIPPGAKIQINGDDKCTSPCSLQLAPGDYRITAQLEGYDSTLSVATLVAGQPSAEVTMTLTSQAQSLRIFSDIPGKVVLDGKPAGDIVEGSFILDRVTAGPHTVAIAGAGADSAFAFDVTPGKAPEIKGPTTAHNLLAVLVSSAGTQARLQSSTPSLKVQLDGKEQAPVTATGTDFPSVPNGDHELVVGEGKDLKKIQVSFLPTPTLTAYLRSDINAGNLVVVTNPPEDDVTVYVNGKPQVRKTSHGQLRVQLVPGNANIRVSKDGFADVQEQVAAIKKGEDTRLEFKLKSLPRVATLRIKAATGGATVLLDGREVGKVSAEGTFQTGGVAPGEHEIEFRMAGFLNKKEARTFKAGETIELSNVALIQAIGTITLTINPAETKVTIRHENDPERPAVGTLLGNLAPGRYVVTGKATGYKEKQVQVTVSGGQTASVDLTLIKDAATVVVPTTRAGGISDFDPPWTRDGEEFSHKGSPIGFRLTPAIGTFNFKVQLLKGGNAFGAGKKIRWALGYTDGKNFTQFEVEKNKFRRNVIVNGKGSKGSEYKWDGQLDTFPVQIEVTPNQIVHKIQIGGQWTIVDRYTDAANLGTGKFIFLVNGNEEIGISDFHFTPH